MKVIKRDGTTEELDLEKWHRVCSWACDGISGVSQSLLEMRSNVQFHDRIKTSDIMELTIKSASDLISEETPNYQYVASRLINYDLRKKIYAHYLPCAFHTHVQNVVNAGFYDSKVLNDYTAEEFEYFDKVIDHTRDFNIPYIGMEQFRGKYLVKHRPTNTYYETPQMAFMLIPMVLFANMTDKDERKKLIKEYYDSLSGFDISLPTPIMAGVRTPQRQFSSCVVLESGDSLDEINAAASAIVSYAAQRAGIGIGAGAIRAIGSPIRRGDATHTGIVPFVKYFQAAVKSCAQGGIRMSSATINFPIWHLEIEDIIVLKNSKGIEENRARHLDYSIHLSRLFYQRLIDGKNITLFSPSDVPGLYEAFYADNHGKFEELYQKYERNTRLRKKVVPAIELFSKLMQERKDTGRIYIMNADHMNTHSPFTSKVAPVNMSNLCQEIGIVTKPFSNVNDESGEIGLCILSAINWGKIKEPSDFEKPCRLVIRGLDALIDIQSYPIIAAEKSARTRRTLGVGIINFAYWMAKNGLKYSTIDKEGLEKIHQYAEAWSYYLIKASVDLAKEKSACAAYRETKWSEGLLPIDTYKKEVDELVEPKYIMDWDILRSDMSKYGIRNSTLMALMPSETSSAVSGSTNGIEPPRAYISIKQSKDGVLKTVVPEYRRLKNKYELLWDQQSPQGYLKICAVLQKFIDQAISVNTSYNPKYFPEEKISMSTLLGDLLTHYRLGGKTLYYHNTHDGAGEVAVDEGAVSEANTEDETEEQECDSCKI